MRISVPDVSSRRVLIILILGHIVGTLFGYTVYISVSSLGDGYQPNELDGYLSLEGNDRFSSTLLTFYIYYFLGFLFPGFYAPMVLGIVIAIITWFTFKDVYKHLRPSLFLICNLFPHFLVWSSASSKEQLVILSGLFVINFAARRSFNAKNLNINLIFVLLALSIIYIIRPNYFIIYFVIFITALFSPVLHKIVSRRLSVGVWVLIFILLTIFVLVFLSLSDDFVDEKVIDYMAWVQHSFLAYETAGSNRYNIKWNDINDFFYNSIWGIPQGFIGPTLLEGSKKPLRFPAFLEGFILSNIGLFVFPTIANLCQI